MLNDFIVDTFRPLFITIENIGPFQNKIVQFDFLKDGEPCNFYFFISSNGMGKTTTLELITLLMELLQKRELEAFGHDGLDNTRGGRVQLDLLFQFSQGGDIKTTIMSLFASSKGEEFLKPWLTSDMDKFNATEWLKYGFFSTGSTAIKPIRTDETVKDFLFFIDHNKDKPPLDFEWDPLTLPTVLYFTSYRNIIPSSKQQKMIQSPDWNYSTFHVFGHDGGSWVGSLDNLLVWLKWLDDGRLEKIIKIINDRVFKGTSKYLKGVSKDPPESEVSNEGSLHRLDQLSSGEKSLVQLFIRIGTHMTQNTIILIDELEIHLHTRLQQRLLNMLKGLAKEHRGLTVIATSHSDEVLIGFAHEVKEEGLVKSGYLIEDDFS